MLELQKGSAGASSVRTGLSERHFGAEPCRGVRGTLRARNRPVIGIPEEPIIHTLDKNTLRRIFDNILSKAAKCSDGDLTVRLSPDGTVLFENGAKELDAVRTAYLFDRFYAVNTARGGTGLGLSIARLFTEKMDGIIAAEYNEGKLKIIISF